MTSKKELNVIVSNGYQPVSSCWCLKSLGLASDKILLLSDESLLKGEDRKKNTIHKSGSSNLLVDKTKSIVKLIIFVYFDYFLYIAFSVTNTQYTYLILKFSGAALIERRSLKERSIYFKIRRVIHFKFQNFILSLSK